MSTTVDTMQAQAEEFRDRYAAIREMIGRVIVGHEEIFKRGKQYRPLWHVEDADYFCLRIVKEDRDVLKQLRWPRSWIWSSIGSSSRPI